ncbi:MAG TPA: tail fiber domain-containing protein, partial [Ferruginibacter sp.]|nr:tail fiber domain-containing protein [Ferruginibacter sp.]
QAYQYHYLDNHPTDRFSNGFMAQDVQKIFPDAVVENELKNGEKRLGINYQYFTVLAIKGLQEQQQQIQSQEERIAKLEALVKTLTGGK